MVNTVVLLSALSLSLLEKYLLRNGWTVRDRTAPNTGMVMSVAEHDFFSETIHYCKPTFYYLEYDRCADVRQGISILARLEGRTVQEMESVICSAFDRPVQGFTCRRCGRCCGDTPDAFRGLVSVEEVMAWERNGHEHILRFIHQEERKGLVRYWAWWHPKKNMFFKRCPWLEKSNGMFSCRIHPIRPLKCLGFPLFEEHALRIGCPGMDESVMEFNHSNLHAQDNCPKRNITPSNNPLD
jgi:Fe-S-cluster containining protein